LSALLEHLKALVACDTQNPPRRITRDDEIFRYIAANLPGFDVELKDAGDGCVTLLAIRGEPTRLMNVHLDTVPANACWEHDPLALRIDDEKAYGLGACDIKGGAAAMIAAANETRGDIAFLFSTDEEYGHSVCVHEFLASEHPLLARVSLVVVSEPTSNRAIAAHRGFARAEKRFFATPGHSSDPRGLDESAVHGLGCWLGRAVERARALDAQGVGGLTGVRFNCGVIEGGDADNIIAGKARALFSVRPPPGLDPKTVATDLLEQPASGARVENEVLFEGPPLPARDAAARVEEAFTMAERFGAGRGPAVDFWTEAALFSAAGFHAFVYGPGNITEAHTANEWVRKDSLDEAKAFFARVIDAEGGAG